MTKDQIRTTPKRHNTVHDTFMGSIVKMSNRNPGNDPLSEDTVMTHYELSCMMTDYVKETSSEDGEIEAYKAAVVLHDFLLYMTNQE